MSIYANLRLSLCILTCFLLAQKGRAFPVMNIGLPELVKRSDVICIGTTRSVHVAGDEKDQQNSTAIAFPATADFSVEQVIKGSLSPRKIRISFSKYNPYYIDGPAFTQLHIGERAVLFLNKKTTTTEYEMTWDESFPGPKILIGTTPLQDISQLTPYRAVLRSLAAGMSDKDITARRTCARFLSNTDVGMILYYWRATYNLKYLTAVRRNLGEPPGGLEAFMAQTIVPALLQATKDPDEQVRNDAFLAVAELHREEALPEIARLVQAEQLYSYPLTFYRTKSALPFLIPLLKSDNAITRMYVAGTLAGIGDRLALPALLDQLNTPHPEVKDSPMARHSVIDALYTITGVPRPKHFFENSRGQLDLSQQNAQQYLNFWNFWATSHSQELSGLRRQMPQPVPPTTS